MAQPKSMPFPGESPTISLALAAGRMYAPKPEGGKKAARSNPKRRPATRKAKRKSGARAR